MIDTIKVIINAIVGQIEHAHTPLDIVDFWVRTFLAGLFTNFVLTIYAFFSIVSQYVIDTITYFSQIYY